jgi:hypothetical protein
MDVCRRSATKEDGSEYYEYFLVYVDDCLVISFDPGGVLKQLETEYKYRLKDVGEPTKFLGAKIGKYTTDCQDLWYISAESYLEKVLVAVEERFGKLDTLFARSRIDTPAPKDFHSEIDISDFLNGEDIDLYQSYIGILRWAVELGRIDLTHFISAMAKFSMVPREGHLTAVILAFGYVKKHLKSKLVIDAEPRDWSHLDWTSSYWKLFILT